MQKGRDKNECKEQEKCSEHKDGVKVLIGAKGIYGMADGFVFVNLTLVFGSVGGSAGIGLVILIMILACFSGMIEMLLRKMVTEVNLKGKGYIAFILHILTGYVASMTALSIWLLA